MLNRLRRRFDDAVYRRVDARFDERFNLRSEELFARLEQAQKDYEARLDGSKADFSFLRSEFDRIAPQVAALEQRFEWVRLQLGDAARDDADALVQARLEHERARLRLELAAHYEERLRRLEAR
ncbi:hypothetical protein [Microbacterium sp. AK031]|uniref:hypothetical protein n=1 Tax=Microbacterium sp. AK031 TaxID=2723076 RepID=UPI00216A3E23|nr:hypothetical protein [Microbacterium sp. AK031]MCS3842117.1 hypothetical protein [Microbacterium sp. AK031]